MLNNLRLFIEEQIGELALIEADFILLVEDELDKTFWANVLNHCNLKPKYEILPSVKSESNNQTTGKGIILKYQSFCTEYPKRLKIAIDSDYDYLLDRGDFNIQNHILQTYTYSIENYFCYASSLESLCLKATQSTTQNIFDFEKFLGEYSKIIYPLFIISLLYDQNKTQFNEETYYSITNFCNDIYVGFQLKKINDIMLSLNNLKEKVETKINNLKANFSDEDYKLMIANIEAKGITTENCYLFIKGHFLLDKLLSPIVKNITEKLSTDVGSKFIDNEEKDNYFSGLKSSLDLLKGNYNMFNCATFKKVETDINHLRSLLQ